MKEENGGGIMAFTCVLYLKEECDGCGMCEGWMTKSDRTWEAL